MKKNLIDEQREVLINFFKTEVKPLIKGETLDEKTLDRIKTRFLIKFPNKYRIIVRRYDETVRVSAYSLALGIIYFLATSTDESKYNFTEPTYWI